MRNPTGTTLASMAERLALRPFGASGRRGDPSLAPLYAPFEFDGNGFDWCAAFVYHVCVCAGFRIPPRPQGSVRCSLAGVLGWLDWSKLRENRNYYSARHRTFRPRPGDLVLFDNLLGQGRCDHIGVVLSVSGAYLRTAEGNVNGRSGVFRRARDNKVRGYIRLTET
jgi:hypothetical protein